MVVWQLSWLSVIFKLVCHSGDCQDLKLLLADLETWWCLTFDLPSTQWREEESETTFLGQLVPTLGSKPAESPSIRITPSRPCRKRQKAIEIKETPTFCWEA